MRISPYTLDRIVIALLVAIAFLLALVVPRLASAQSLVGDFAATAALPDACTLKAAGGPVVVNDIAGALNPSARTVSFPLASITTFGTYTLTATCTKAGGVTNGTNGGTVTTPGSASSTPFAYSYAVAPVTAPAVRLAP